MLTKFRLNVYPPYYLLEGILLMEEIPNNHVGCENHVINCQPQLVSQISSINCITVRRFDISFLHSRSLTWPLKSYWNPKETACLPTIHFQGRTVKHWGRWVVSTTWHQIIGTCPVHPVHPVHPLQFSPVASTGFKATTPPFPIVNLLGGSSQLVSVLRNCGERKSPKTWGCGTASKWSSKQPYEQFQQVGQVGLVGHGFSILQQRYSFL